MKYDLELQVEFDWSAPIIESFPVSTIKEAFEIASSLVRYYTDKDQYSDAWSATALIIRDNTVIASVFNAVYCPIQYKRGE